MTPERGAAAREPIAASVLQGDSRRELLRAVRRIVGEVELAAMDIVEVSPPYDWAESTAMIANRCALEAISALAVKHRDGRDVRFSANGTRTRARSVAARG